MDALRELERQAPGSANPDWKKMGNAFLAQGQLEDAVGCYRKAVKQDPDDPYAHLNLAFGLSEQDKPKEAAESLRASIAIDSGIYDTHYLLGQALASQDLFADATISFKNAVALKADFDIGYRDLGRALERLEEFEPALTAYRHALLLNPDFLEVMHLLVQLLLQQEQYGEALNWLDRLDKRGESSDSLDLSRSQALHGLMRFHEALDLAGQVVARDSKNALAWHAKGNVLFALDRFEEAVTAYERALQLNANFVEAISNCGAAYQKMGLGERAIEYLERAITIRPDHRHALYSLAFALMADGQGRAALEVSARALNLWPDNAELHWNNAIVHLLYGEFDKGWIEYEWRWKANTHGAKLVKPDLPQPMWTGQDLDGKTIMLLHEQGLGDTIQFVRYAEVIFRERHPAKVLIKIPDLLHPLLSELPEGCTLVKNSGEMPPFDFYCSMLSIPAACGTGIETIPATVPYIRCDAVLRQQWETRLGPRQGVRVGIVWSGNAAHQNDRNRSIALAALIEDVPDGCQLISLQKEVRTQDQSTLDQHPEVLDFAGELRSFADTAALIDCVDVVVSVDTSVAHLAGAMGRPLWILLPRHPDWRWMLDRDDTPWYPTARLFRQPKHGDWASVLARVRAELQTLLPVTPA